MAITAGQPETAVEFLERGRGVLLDRLLDDSADLARLNEIDPERAASSRTSGVTSKALSCLILRRIASSCPLRPPSRKRSRPAQRARASARRPDQRDPRPARMRQPVPAARFPGHCAQVIGSRSVAVINVSAYRCDALIVAPGGVTITPLPALTRQDAERAAEFFRTRAEEAPRQDRVGEEPARNSQTSSRGCGTPWPSPSCADTRHYRSRASRPRYRACTGARPARPPSCLSTRPAVTANPARQRPGLSSTAPNRCTSPSSAPWRLTRPDQAVSQETSQPPLIVSMPTTPGWRPLPRAEDRGRLPARHFPGRGSSDGRWRHSGRRSGRDGLPLLVPLRRPRRDR